MDLSLIGKYGECVFDTFVDRLTASSITIRAVWMRPVDDPFGAKKMVTAGFLKLLGSRGGVSLLEERILPKMLVSEQSTATGGTAKKSGGWGWGWLPFGQTRAKSATSPETEHDNRPHWLCVSFSVPGGVEFIASYKIPEEPITFPPLSTNPRSMTPIERQIIFGGIVHDVYANQDDDDRVVLLDFTAWIQKMAGPNGDFFGRTSLDLRLAIAESITERQAAKRFFYMLLDHVLNRKIIATVLEYADGSDISVNTCDFAIAP